MKKLLATVALLRLFSLTGTNANAVVYTASGTNPDPEAVSAQATMTFDSTSDLLPWCCRT